MIFDRLELRFSAILRNFAGQIPHIRQGLSSEQFCLRVALFLHRHGRARPGHPRPAKRREECGCPGQPRAWRRADSMAAI